MEQNTNPEAKPRDLEPTSDVDRKKLAAGFLILLFAVVGLLMFALRGEEAEKAEPEARVEDPELRTQAYQRQLDREDREAIEQARRDSLRAIQEANREQRLAERRAALDAFELVPEGAAGPAGDRAGSGEDDLRARLAAARQQQAGSVAAGPTMPRSRRTGRANQQQQQDPAQLAFQTALKAPLMGTNAGGQTGQQAPARAGEAPSGARSGAPEVDDPFAQYLMDRMEAEDARAAEAEAHDAALLAAEMGYYQSHTGQPQSASQGGSGGAPDTRSFNERVADEARSEAYVQAEFIEQLTPYELKAGSIIPAVLITGLNSDLPGDVVAQVSRDVYDSQQQRFLIVPKGTRLLGRYDSDVAFGQTRALIAWTRMVYPDGRSVALPGFNATGKNGMTGLRDGVDRHLLAAFGSAGAIAVLGAGVQLAADSGDDGGGVNQQPDPQDVIASQIALEISRVATELLRRNLDRAPTVTIRPGFRFNVFVNRDLALPQPYRDAGTAPRFVRSPETRLLRAPAPRGAVPAPHSKPEGEGQGYPPTTDEPAAPSRASLVRSPAPRWTPAGGSEAAGGSR